MVSGFDTCGLDQAELFPRKLKDLADMISELISVIFGSLWRLGEMSQEYKRKRTNVLIFRKRVCMESENSKPVMTGDFVEYFPKGIVCENVEKKIVIKASIVS